MHRKPSGRVEDSWGTIFYIDILMLNEGLVRRDDTSTIFNPKLLKPETRDFYGSIEYTRSVHHSYWDDLKLTWVLNKVLIVVSFGSCPKCYISGV